MSYNYSVIICTHNRADSLKKTLVSIGKVTLQTGETAELIVIDNRSTDHTKQVVESFVAPQFDIRYVYEPLQGVAPARNAALKNAAGEILVWTDDDVIVPTDWVTSLTQPIREGTFDAVAGGIVPAPHLAVELDKEPLASLKGWFACSSYLDPDNPNSLIGANMAFHRRVLDAAPTFDLQLGPGTGHGFFEETLFSWQIKAAGFRLGTNFKTEVVHYFQENRLLPEAVMQTARKMGRSHAYIFHHWHHKKSNLIGFRNLSYHIQRICTDTLRLLTGKSKEMPSLKRIKLESRIAFSEEYMQIRTAPIRYQPEEFAKRVASKTQ